MNILNFRKPAVFASSMLLGLLLANAALADPITHVRTESNIDWTSAGIAGVGSPGNGNITIAGVSGTVKLALLYWHGIDGTTVPGGDGNYDNPVVSINGNPVTGTAIGTATTNCWGDGNSVAYRADVTSIVAAAGGNGAYAITGMSALPGHSANGASLVVVFDDGNTANNRDLVFFEGNDSNFANGFPGETDGWHATLTPINYQGGPVSAQFHGGDGQDAGDGILDLVTANGALNIPDTNTLWDGISTPTMGAGRNGHGLWDIHDFDITGAFGAVANPAATLQLDGQTTGSDCLGLVLALVDLEPGSAPPPRQDINLLPETAKNCTTDPHTVTATLIDDTNTPIVGKTVSFSITSGPNIGQTSSAVSDASGKATWTYTSPLAGTDKIEGCFTDDQNVEKCDTVEKVWNICNLPPDCTNAQPTKLCLWQPNHKFTPVSIKGVTDPDGDPVSIIINKVTSDEKTATERGAGGIKHAPDATGLGDDTVDLRAERSGINDGRVYGLNFIADDGNGGQCSGTAYVKVPHDQNKKTCNAVDSGQNYNAAE